MEGDVTSIFESKVPENQVFLQEIKSELKLEEYEANNSRLDLNKELRDSPKECPLKLEENDNAGSEFPFEEIQIANTSEFKLKLEDPERNFPLSNLKEDSIDVASNYQPKYVIITDDSPLVQINRHGSKTLPNTNELYKCNLCNYSSTVKYNFTRHQNRHKIFSKDRIFKCDSCDFKTLFKSRLAIHQARDPDDSKDQNYRCDLCDFTTFRSGCFAHHQLIHKEVTDVQPYECEFCDYKTTHKSSFTRHQMVHYTNSTSDCKHQLEHKPEPQPDPKEPTHGCEVCDFTTRRKDSLKLHQLIHQSSSKEQTLKCEQCTYETSRKVYFRKHQLKHEGSERETYKCASCDFTTNISKA